MLRVVLDTNIVVSAFMTHKGKEWQVIKKIVEGKITSITSKEILQEVENVLSRPKFGCSKDQVDEILLFLSRISHIIEPYEKIGKIKKDLEDNKFLECAACCGADYIVSGDRHLLELESFRGIEILRAPELLEKIQ